MNLRTIAVSLALMSALLGACGGNTGAKKDVPDVSEASMRNMDLAIAYFRQGDLSSAKEKIERALEQDSRNAQAQMFAGILYQRLKEDDKADMHFDRALSLESSNSEIRNSYGQFLCARGKYARGEKLLVAAAADTLYKTPELAYLNAGYCARGAGDMKKAEQHFRSALAKNPTFTLALLEMADLEFKSNQPLLARAFLERYFSAASATPAALLLGVKIENALGNRQHAEDYARRLRADFSDSPEARSLAAPAPPPARRVR